MTTPGFGGGDANSAAAAVYFSSLNNSYLETALRQARDGALTPTWREELRPLVSGEAQGVALGDAGQLAIEEIRQMPYAAWEPGHVPHWRAALDTWYVASRAVVVHKYALATRQLIGHMAAGADRILSNCIQLRALGSDQSLADRLFSSVIPMDETSDKTRSQAERVYVQSRDRLTASYLAGLAAGGDDIDWLAWFKARVDRWPSDDMGTRRARIELGGETFRRVMERLPDYWT